MATLRLLFACVVGVVLLSGCLGVVEDEEATAMESLRLKRAAPTPPKCITPRGPCACETDQGLIDLSAIDNKDGTKAFFANIRDDGYSYYGYNPCTPFTENRCSQAAVCKCYGPSYCVAYGSHANVKFQNDPLTQQLTITYPTSSRESAIVTLVCDETTEGKVVLTYSQNPSKLTLTSKHACPQGSGSMSVGSILIIVFFTVVGVYLIGGILYMHFAKGAQGVEKIPNSGFWISVPGLVKDGGTFVVTAVKGGGSSGKSSYDQL